MYFTIFGTPLVFPLWRLSTFADGKMDLKERTFESLGNRLSKLDYMCVLNDTLSKKLIMLG